MIGKDGRVGEAILIVIWKCQIVGVWFYQGWNSTRKE